MIGLDKQMEIDTDTSDSRFDLNRVLARSENLQRAPEIDAEMNFSEGLSRVPDEMDLFIRRGIIAGRVSSGAGMMAALGVIDQLQ